MTSGKGQVHGTQVHGGPGWKRQPKHLLKALSCAGGWLVGRGSSRWAGRGGGRDAELALKILEGDSRICQEEESMKEKKGKEGRRALAEKKLRQLRERTVGLGS